MNRYPLWKYLLIVFTIAVAAVYSLPNLFGETPAVQVSTNRQAIIINEQTQSKVDAALKNAGIQTDGMFVVDNSLKVRFKDTETQLKARDVIENTLGEGYITALNLLADSPEWMAKIKANPMFLGLDLRGGVHFTMQVDMKAAMQKTFERYSGDIRRELRREKIRSGTVRQAENSLTVPLQDAGDVQKALPQLLKLFPEATLNSEGSNIVLALSEEAVNKVRSDAVKQNITTLHNRVNELGVAEPIIQQSGLDRIVVQLPGVQDTAKAKDIIGRTATLEVRMVEDDPAKLREALEGNVPSGYELLSSGRGASRNSADQQTGRADRRQHQRCATEFRPNGRTCRQSELGQRGRQHFRRTDCRKCRQTHGDGFDRPRKIRGCNRTGYPYCHYRRTRGNFRKHDDSRSQRYVFAVACRFSCRTDADCRRTYHRSVFG